VGHFFILLAISVFTSARGDIPDPTLSFLIADFGAPERDSKFLPFKKDELNSIQAEQFKNCSTINMYETKGVFYGVQPSDQGGLGVCYAHNATDHYDSFLRLYSPNYTGRTSPIGTAVSTAKSVFFVNSDPGGRLVPAYDFEGGQFCDAIDALISRGGCSYDEVEGKLYGANIRGLFDSRKRGTYLKLHHSDQFSLWLFDTLSAHLLNSNPASKTVFEAFDYPGKRALMEANLGNMCTNAANNIFEELGVTADELTKYVTDSKLPSAFIEKIVNSLCKRQKNEIAQLIKCEENDFSLGQRYAVKGKIEDALSENSNQPLSIGFCGNLLKNNIDKNGRSFGGRGFKGRAPSFESYIQTTSSSEAGSHLCGAHAASIVGREFKKIRTPEGKIIFRCQYLIRNSWGSSCESYHRDWVCNENGSIWVDSDVIQRNVFRVSRLVKKNE
jgi:hypothetical protein